MHWLLRIDFNKYFNSVASSSFVSTKFMRLRIIPPRMRNLILHCCCCTESMRFSCRLCESHSNAVVYICMYDTHICARTHRIVQARTLISDIRTRIHTNHVHMHSCLLVLLHTHELACRHASNRTRPDYYTCMLPVVFGVHVSWYCCCTQLNLHHTQRHTHMYACKSYAQ